MDRQAIFEILDAKGVGAISVSQLVSGLLRMRSGGTDRSDIVATIIGIRTVQRDVDNLCMMVNEMRNTCSDYDIPNRFLRNFQSPRAVHLEYDLDSVDRSNTTFGEGGGVDKKKSMPL